MIPFDREFAAQSAEEFVRDVLVDRLGPSACRSARTSASARARGATPTSCARTTSSRRAWCRWSRWRGRRCRRATSAG